MDERKTLRVVTDLQTEARIRGHSVVLLLYNLSQGGCMVEVPDACLQIGDNLHLRLCGFEHGGTVVWEQAGYAGVSFFLDLAPEVVTYLGYKPGTVPFNEVQPRDRFGRPLPALSSLGGLAG